MLLGGERGRRGEGGEEHQKMRGWEIGQSNSQTQSRRFQSCTDMESISAPSAEETHARTCTCTCTRTHVHIHGEDNSRVHYDYSN